jgi:hemerythrin-like domain-containing protein
MPKPSPRPHDPDGHHGGRPVSLGRQPTRRELRRRAIERMLAHRPFHRMLSRQGVDLARCWEDGLERMIFEALHLCERCANTGGCRDWLRSDRERASYVAFCPNALLIEACRIIDPDALPLGDERPEDRVPGEPSLVEILAEPIVKLLMAADRQEAADTVIAMEGIMPESPGAERQDPIGAERQDPIAAERQDPIAAEHLDPIAALRREHRNMATLLRALEWQVTEFENGKQPDYELVTAVLDYFLSFPDIYHHPKEELIFAALQLRDRESAQRIGDLGIAHQDLASRAREFATALRAVLDEAEMSRAAFARWARGFIEVQRRHIDVEEGAFFPAAEKALTAQDWADLGARMTAADDPLLGGHVGERFEQLRRTILAWQAQDQAVSAEE